MTDRSSSLKLRVLTWNVLADCYAKASPSSHATSSLPSYAAQPLPNPSSTSWSSRQDLLERTLFAQTGVDIYTLQEVDHFHDFFQPLFARRGYQTLFAQRPRKQDGCLIAYRDNQHELIASEIIDLDRLAYLDQTKDNFAKNCTSRFAKQNLALLACFQNKLTKQYFLIITCHIHWNPNLPEVKFAQVTMILQEIQLFLASRKHLQNMPILWSGDFNSFPTDEIYDYITSMQSRSLQIHQKYHQMMFQQVSFGNSFLFGPNTKFLCESSLIRLSRWMRMLGVNVAMGSWEVANSTSATKQQAIQAFFQRAKDEKRVILTTSRTLTERGNCPQSFFVNPSRLEDGLIAIYRQFGLALQRERFLTVCGKCGGEIQEANLLDPRLMGKILPCDRAVFMCIACAQVRKPNLCILSFLLAH